MIASHGKYINPDYGNEMPELIKEIVEIFTPLKEFIYN